MKKYNGHSSSQNPFEKHKHTNSSVLTQPFEIYHKKQEQPMQSRSRSQLLIRSLPFVKRIENSPQLPDFNQQIGTPLRSNFAGTPNQRIATNSNYFSNNNSNNNYLNNNNANAPNNASLNLMARSQVKFYVQNLGTGFQTSRKFYNAAELLPQKIGSTRYAKPSPYSQPSSPSSSPQATASATAYRSTASNFPTFKTRFTATEGETNESAGKYPLKTNNFEDTNNLFGDASKNYRTTENNELLNSDPNYSEVTIANGQQQQQQFFLNQNNNQAFSETQKQFFENFMQDTKPIVSNNTPVMSEAAISEEYPFKFQADIASLENPNSSIAFLNGFPHNLPFIENTLRAASKARDELIATKNALKQEINDLHANFEAQILEFTQETAYLSSKVSLEIKSDFAQQQTKQFALSKELVKLVKDKMKLESDLDQQLVKARRLEEKLLGQEVFNVEPVDETFKNITCNNLRQDSFSPFSTQAQQQLTFQAKMLH